MILQLQWRTQGGWGYEPPTTLSKIAKKVFKKGVSLYLKEFEGCCQKPLQGYAPRQTTARILDTPV